MKETTELVSLRNEPLIRLRLIPVQIFGANSPTDPEPDDALWGYGLNDATGGMSDCNRAAGHIYRIADEDEWKAEGDFVEVHVTPAQAEWLKQDWEHN